MRGEVSNQQKFFSYVPLESQVPQDHKLRVIREIVEDALCRMDRDFERAYSGMGRPSIAPEYLLKAMVLQIFYSIRSERQLVEHLKYNMLFRWFVGLNEEDRVWDATVFTKNRDRLLEAGIDQKFFDKILWHAGKKKMLSDDHFTVDGSLVQAWASHKSFQKKEVVSRNDDKKDPPQGGATAESELTFKGEKRSNKTHESKTDPDARLFRKSFNTGAMLSMMGHVLMENRNGLCVECDFTHAENKQEREVAKSKFLKKLASKKGKQRTLGADKGYDVNEFVQSCRKARVVPHIAKKKSCGSALIDGRVTRHPGYEISQQKRKRVEEIFGWLKSVGPFRQVKWRGIMKVGWMWRFGLATYNVLRIANLQIKAGV
jgi:transposase